MKRSIAFQLILGLFFSQFSLAEAVECTVELVLACVFGGLWGLFLIALFLYCCCKRFRRKKRGKPARMSSSIEEGDGVFSISSMNLYPDLNGGEKRQRAGSTLLCAQCNQRMERAYVDVYEHTIE